MPYLAVLMEYMLDVCVVYHNVSVAHAVHAVYEVKQASSIGYPTHTVLC